jgi:DNA-directed RNA polymerase specialized sigma24 family protein
MNLHANATTCPNSRELLARRVIEEGWSHARAAEAAGVSKRTVEVRSARARRVASEPPGSPCAEPA